MKKLVLIQLTIILLFGACTSLVLKPANFAWPVEAVLAPDENGTVQDERYSVSFNVSQIFFEEFADAPINQDKQIRIIRNTNGFYFVTSKEFKNVYVFAAGDASLNLVNKILISENGLQNPVMNQRAPYIELIDGETNYNLTSKGITGK